MVNDLKIYTTEIKHTNQTIGCKIATNRFMNKFDGFHVVIWSKMTNTHKLWAIKMPKKFIFDYFGSLKKVYR